MLWTWSGLFHGNIRDLVGYSWAMLPVLAITSAISLLGATTFLARYSTFDTLTKTFSDISEVLRQNYTILRGHPRETKLARVGFHKWLFSRIKIDRVLLASLREPHFVVRPYWDGVWFFGTDEYNAIAGDNWRTFLAFHETVICGTIALRFVGKLREQKLGVISHKFSGTQGSLWFLESFEKQKKLIEKKITELTFTEAVQIILLTRESLHYVLEEFGEHQQGVSWEEYRELRFMDIFLNYLLWTTYFHTKLFGIRVANVLDYKKAKGKDLPQSGFFNEEWKVLAELKANVFKFRETVIPRKGVAEKIVKVRLGSIVPLVLTAAALITYSILQPLAFGSIDQWYARVVATVAYALGATAIVQNFLFGFWLLIPWRISQKGTPLP